MFQSVPLEPRNLFQLVVSVGVLDIFADSDRWKSDLSICSDEFPVVVRALPQQHMTLDLL